MRRCLRVGVVHTVGSVCRCAQAISEGLRALGHSPVLVDSAMVEARAEELAEGCHLVFDHTDTFGGRGLFRALVRMILEGKGARLVGSPGRACFLADQKPAAKATMARAGIPTLPGVIIHPGMLEIPSWLRGPWVVKQTSEHMSRGVRAALTPQELEAHLRSLEKGSPSSTVMVETYVPGVELAVPVLEEKGEPRVLPILEMREARLKAFLDEEFKQLEFKAERQDMGPAQLEPALEREIRLMACKAFEVLGLRDYARFDVRLSQDGTPFFLEANVTPSMEPFEAMALSARIAGMPYTDLISKILESALARYGEDGLVREQSLEAELPSGPLRLIVPPGVVFPAQSSLEMARILDVRPGEKVLELGCGCGLLSIVSAKLGAQRVVATDLDPACLKATLANAKKNGVEEGIQVRAGSWFQALDPLEEKDAFHVILATPPQTPSPRPMGPKYGGQDGLWHIKRIAAWAPSFLESKEGRLWLLAISLVDQKELLRILGEHFQKVELVKTTWRDFEPQEYESLEPGLFAYLQGLASSGKACIQKRESGKFAFQNLFIRASHPKKTK